MPSLIVFLLLFLIVLCFLPSGAYAFGAGDIPDFAWLNDKAYRHGDIENILTDLVKTSAHSHGGGSLLGFAKKIINTAKGGAKFSKEDVKKVYFGNWLRDYSQAMDIAGLSKLTADTLVMVVAVLGFLEFGFATNEFEVTADRLGVYLPVEHIDNPKGYAAKEGDARQFHPKLRPPVDNRELEIDERTGMKKYMATENEGWDTSTAFIRRSFKGSIEHGRRADGREGGDLWEAYRLLGQGLHTLEDLLAHSNWCEIALNKLGHKDVFCHVGDNVRINTPKGRAAPLVTGTFGSADFFHSLLGEATDKLSQTSMEDLSLKLSDAKKQDQNQKLEILRQILRKVIHSGGGNEDDKMQQADDMKKQSQAYHFNPDNIMPPEVQKRLLDLLKWRDGIMRDVIKQIEMIPGLSDLIDSLSDALNAYVYTLLAPYLTPILEQVTTVVGEGSKAVIDSDDQYEVFNNPNASDPSHSMMSKDHFALILNEPAGWVAKIVVEHTVNQIVEAWSSDENPDDVINRILEAFHHPYYATGYSEVQNNMIRKLEEWLNSVENQKQVLQGLTKESVKNHKNKRFSEEQQQQVSDPHGHGHSTSHGGGGGAYSQTSYGRQQGSYGSSQDYGGQQSYGGKSNLGGDSYGSRHPDSSSYGTGGDDNYSSHQHKTSYGGSQSQQTYGGGDVYGSHRQESSYGGSQSQQTRVGGDSYGSHRQESSYGGSQSQQTRVGGDNYGGHRQESSYGGSQSQQTRGGGDTYGSHRQESSYGSSSQSQQTRVGGDNYGGHRQESSYGGSQSQQTRGGGDSYGSHRQQSSYGSSGGRRGSDSSSDDSHGNRRQESSHGRGHKGERGSRHHESSSGASRGDESSSKSGRGESYGGGYQQQQSYSSRDADDNRGSSHQSYGQREESHREESRSTRYQPSYGSRDDNNRESYGSSGYGQQDHTSSRREESHGSGGGFYNPAYSQESTYGSSRGGGGGEYGGGFQRRDDNEGGYGGSGYGGGRRHQGGGFDDGGETFGAERLNINDDNEGSSRRRKNEYGGGERSYGGAGFGDDF